ncbi:MAG: ABC transporter permease [Anaerolineae bacterium]|nr:ABC transporter permease [Anaerolineae bacterium]
MSGAQLQDFVTVLLSAGLIAAVPLLLAALGETFAERAGLLNLGLEGMMLLGAFGGFFVALNSGSTWAGLAAGLGIGLMVGLLFGWLTITLQVDQVIVGLGLTIFGGGLTGFLFRDLYGQQFPTLAASAQKISVPFLSSIPILGPALFQQQLVVYLAWGLVAVFAFILTRTRFGLEIRAVGESPLAADAAGVNVARTRYLAILIGGMMAGLGGAFLSVGDLNFFVPGMTVGQGFIAIAIAMLGKWRPYRVFIGAVLFGLLRSLANGLQIIGVNIQPEFILMLPYLGIIVALVLLAGRTSLPAALGVPYRRGQK